MRLSWLHVNYSICAKRLHRLLEIVRAPLKQLLMASENDYVNDYGLFYYFILGEGLHARGVGGARLHAHSAHKVHMYFKSIN